MKCETFREFNRDIRGYTSKDGERWVLLCDLDLVFPCRTATVWASLADDDKSVIPPGFMPGVGRGGMVKVARLSSLPPFKHYTHPQKKPARSKRTYHFSADVCERLSCLTGGKRNQERRLIEKMIMRLEKGDL